MFFVNIGKGRGAEGGKPPSAREFAQGANSRLKTGLLVLSKPWCHIFNVMAFCKRILRESPQFCRFAEGIGGLKW